MKAHEKGKDTERAEDARRTHTLVSALLNELLINASLSTAPLVLAGGCKLIGSFSPLLAGDFGRRGVIVAVAGPGSSYGRAGGGGGRGGAGSGYPVLSLAIGYLSAGLQHKASRNRAAISLRTLAANCERAIVADPTSLDSLLRVSRWGVSTVGLGMGVEFGCLASVFHRLVREPGRPDVVVDAFFRRRKDFPFTRHGRCLQRLSTSSGLHRSKR